MKKKILFSILSVLLICIFGLSLRFIIIPSFRHISKKDITETSSGFYVDGTTLYDVNGNPFVFRGINSAHCWYKDMDSTAFDAIAATGANCVRIVCSCGIQWEKDSPEEIAELINAATQRNMIAILEVHDGTGSGDINVLKDIANFWIELTDVLVGTEDKCIINIANEWGPSYISYNWFKGYKEVIPMLRNAGIKNTLMIDACGWGQNFFSVKNYGVEVFNSDPDRNTMFSIHMYGLSGRNSTTINWGLGSALKQNLCVCVGEFGYMHSDGDVDENYLMKYCSENNIGYLPWSWKGNSGGVEYLDLALEWDGSVLSSDWGENVINNIYGIRNTSEICSIFK